MSLAKCIPLAAALMLAACSPSPSPPAAAPKANPAIDGIIGLHLGDEYATPDCKGEWHEKQPVLPCNKVQGSAFGITILLPEAAVPSDTHPEADIGLLDGKIASIRVRTYLPIERAAGMLVEKWGAANGPSDQNAIRWTGDRAEALLFPDTPERGEHMILVQSFAYTAAENDRRRAEEAASPKF